MRKLIIDKIKQAGFLFAVVLFLTSSLFAQSNSGSITGFVFDQNNAAVANASVTITNVGTNESRTVQTDSDGRYEVPSLSTGVYKVTATANGFQETSVTNVRLAVGEKARVDVNLSVGGVGGTVTVSAEQTRVNTETSELADTIDEKQVQDLPVNGRDFTQLLATVPGSVQSTNQFQTSINGIPSTFGNTSVLVDGIDAGRVDLNGTSNVLGRIESRVNRISMDSVQEVQVLQQNYSAQYGQATGAVINPITKSGTNNFHGSIFNYIRHESLDANDFFNNRFGLPRSKFRLNQFGGNVSGRIIRDKLFFFTNYEGVRQTRGQTFTTLVPTAAFRATFNPVIRPVLNTIPLPSAPFFRSTGGIVSTTPDPQVGIYTAQREGKLREDTGSFKIDWLHTEKSQFSVRYNINDSETTTPYGVGTDQFADGDLRVQLFKASHNYSFTGNTVNEFAFGINRNVTDVGAGPSTLPRFDLSFADQAIATPGPAQFAQYRTGTVYHFLDTLTSIQGNHALKFGTDIRLNRRTAISEVQETLTFFSLNDFRDNVPFVVSRGGHPELEFANENFSFFFQDDWKAHPRLTLNLGLRYDVSTVSREKEGRLQNFDPVKLTYSPLGEKIHEADTNNWGPRIGFAFDIFGNQKTVLRGGYGIFYNRELPASFGSPHVNTFPTESVDLIRALFICGIFPQYPVAPASYDCANPSAFAIDRDLKTPMAQHYSFNIQQDLRFAVLQVGYVGNQVKNILTDGVVSPVNINRKDPFDIFGLTRVYSQNFSDIFLVGDYPWSKYNSLQISLRRNLSRGFRFNANYTYGHAIDTVVGFFRDYQDPKNTEAEKAPSDQDIRHNFTFDASYDLPLRDWFGGPRWLAEGWQLNTITIARSGFPVNVTRQGGIFGGFSFRPNLVPGVDTRCPNYSLPDCQFNPAAFSDPGVGVYGNLPRNFLRGPNFFQVDFSVFKNTRLTENTSLQFRVEIFNLFNRANFADPSGGLVRGDNNTLRPSAFFGQSTSTVGNQLGGLLGYGGPRQIQLSARFNF